MIRVENLWRRFDVSKPWLNRVIARQRENDGADARFAAMEAEGWQE